MAGTWTYDPTTLATSQVNQIRRLVGDVLSSDQQIFNEEIAFALTQRPNVYGAAADCCRYIAAQYARKVDTIQPGPLSVMYSSQSKNYQTRANELDKLASLRGGGMPYAGGISVMDKLTQVLDSDRVTPSFNIGMQDSYSPIPPAGNVVPSNNPDGEIGGL